MNFPVEYLIYGLATLNVILLIAVLVLYTKVKKLLVGKNAATLEDTILNIKKGLETEQKFKKDMQDYLTVVEKRLRKSIQGVGTVRFNAFKGIGEGGGQSFATAYLSEKGDGVILSSLYSRDHVSIFAKPVTTYKSEFELTPEESEAVEKARVIIKN